MSRMGSQFLRIDEQWVPLGDIESEDSRPASAKQLSYIEALAREAGVKVNLEPIETSAQASKVITRLKQLSGQKPGVDLRDSRVAFGMATKLVFKKYADSHRDYRKAKSFWREVREFYLAYQREQESAVRGEIASAPNGAKGGEER